MQLNKFSDYALRILMTISAPREQPYTIAEIAQTLQVSQNHLVKIVHFMAKQQWLITTRGKGGGIEIDPRILDLGLGDVVRILQGNPAVVECNTPPCVLRYSCGLKGILDHAQNQFYLDLNQYKMQQVLKPKTCVASAAIQAIPTLSLD